MADLRSRVAEDESPAEPPRAEHYPPYVKTGEERHRWDLVLALARLIHEEDEAAVWMAARALYQGDIPT